MLLSGLKINSPSLILHPHVACECHNPEENKKSRRPTCAIDQGALRCPCRCGIQYGGSTDHATINTNFMPEFKQKIQHCYRNQFFVTKDM